LIAITALAAVPPNLAKAVEEQRRLAIERPQDATVFNDLGNLLILAARPEEAEAAYRRAVELDPQKLSALFNLARLLQERGELREALRFYRKVVEVEPRHAWAHYQIGTLREGWGQEEEAIESYATAFALEPQLTFSDVNPHLVENRLVTQAILRAYRSEYVPPQAPMVYEDRARIADLLVPPPAKTEPQAREEMANQPAEPQRPAPPGPAGQGSTVLRPGNLDPASAAGQATPPGMRGGRPNPGVRPNVGVPRSLRQWDRPQPQEEEVPFEGREDEEPGQVITPPPGGVYYQPGIPSTGRLNLRLLSEADRDVRG
jgi:hypothetical protein